MYYFRKCYHTHMLASIIFCFTADICSVTQKSNSLSELSFPVLPFLLLLPDQLKLLMLVKFPHCCVSSLLCYTCSDWLNFIAHVILLFIGNPVAFLNFTALCLTSSWWSAGYKYPLFILPPALPLHLLLLPPLSSLCCSSYYFCC